MQGPVKVKALFLSELLPETSVTWPVFPYTGRTGRLGHRGRGKFDLCSPFLFQEKTGITGEEMRQASAQLAGKSILGCVG